MASLQFDKTRKQFILRDIHLPGEPTRRRLPRGASKAQAEDILTRIKMRELEHSLGMVDDAAEKLRAYRAAPIEEHLEAFENGLSAKGNGYKHIDATMSELRRIVEGCGYQTIADLEDLSRLDAYRRRLRERHRGERTCGRPLVLVKQFCRWLVTANRATRDPYAGVHGPRQGGRVLQPAP
jgi:hypothetical protein